MTVSTAGFFTRRTTFGAAFFTGAGLGLALATIGFVAFAAPDTLRALRRLAEFPPRNFARFCNFDAFLRLAIIDSPLVSFELRTRSKDPWASPGNPSYELLTGLCFGH
jgi:hypothetical protein